MDAVNADQTWNDQNVERLKQLYADGLSMSEIAAEIGGMSRNAVMGKVHRLGLVLRGKTPAKPKVAKPKPRALHWTGFPKRKSPDRKPPMIVDGHQSPKVECVPLNIRFLDTTDSQCKYIIGDANGAETICCGLPSEEGKPYCWHHDRACHVRHIRGEMDNAESAMHRKLIRKHSRHSIVPFEERIPPASPGDLVEQLPDVA